MHRPPIALLVAAVLVPLAAACGGEDEATDTPAATGGTATAATGVTDAPAGAATDLRITVWTEGRDAGEGSTVTLTCDPTGGTHPAPDAACAALAEGGEWWAPPAGDLACTEIYGGPAEAHVIGTVDGQAVETRLRRTDGCEIARWDAIAAALPGDVAGWTEAIPGEAPTTADGATAGGGDVPTTSP